MVIPNNIYKDSTLRLPRAYLNACPQQSIFVSFGDNDYYPMLYLQLAEGLRKDVYVINYSLLGVDRFIYHITMSQFDARPIKLSVDTTMYAGEVNDLIYLHDSTNSITASELINFIRTDKGDELGRKILEVGTIEMPLKRAGRYNTTARVSMEDNNYLFKNLWVLIDMINNLEGRVLCFPDKIQGQLRGLNEYLTPVKAKLLYLYNN